MLNLEKLIKDLEVIQEEEKKSWKKINLLVEELKLVWNLDQKNVEGEDFETEETIDQIVGVGEEKEIDPLS